MSTPYAIATQQLTRSYGGVRVVRDLKLQVRPRCIYGFLGPNGAGKTTTIRMLLGLIRPDYGEVSLLGLNLSTHRKAVLAKVGSMVESPSIYPHLTGKENIEVLTRLAGIKPGRIEKAFQQVELTDAADKKAGQYSQGMKQRLGLAMALVNEPQLLILDEPANGLDPAGIRNMRELFKRLTRESGITVFLSSHLLAEIELVATELGIIHQGTLVFQGTPQELKQNRSHQVFIRTSDPLATYELARGKATQCRLDEDGRLGCNIQNQEEIAELNRLLVQAGLRVYSIECQEQRLEDFFIQLTAGRE